MNASERKRCLALRRVSKLTLVVALKDDAKADKRPEGDVFVMTGGVKRDAAAHGGYYPIIDIPGNSCAITVGGRLYHEETVHIDITGLDPKAPFKEIGLRPRALALPQPQPDTILKGRILDIADNTPVAGARITVKTMRESAVSGADGGFSMTFKELEADIKVTLVIKNDLFKTKEKTVQMNKEITTIVPDIKLTRK